MIGSKRENAAHDRYEHGFPQNPSDRTPAVCHHRLNRMVFHTNLTISMNYVIRQEIIFYPRAQRIAPPNVIIRPA